MNIKEIWKEIPEYYDYLISNFGRVKSKERLIRYTHSVTGNEHFRKTEEKFLVVYMNNRTGYKFVQLKSDKKSKNFSIHRLVAMAFIENSNNHPVVNHIDGNKHNNTVENLEWCTNEYNHEHATKTGLKARGTEVGGSILNDTCVFAIKNLFNSGLSHNDISKFFGVKKALITQILTGKLWTHVQCSDEVFELKIKDKVYLGKNVCLIDELGNIKKKYASLKKAGIDLKLDPAMIGKVASGKFKQYKGYMFMYSD